MTRKTELSRAARVRMIVLLLLVQAATAAFPMEDKHVLILHSYHQSFDWTSSIQTGIESAFSAMESRPTLFVEHLEAKRLPAAHESEALRDYLSEKYGSTHLDLVLVSDGFALSFMLEHGELLFPGVPIVFAGISSAELFTFGIDMESIRAGSGDHGVVGGVLENIDVRSTIELGLTLWPDTRTVFALVDDSVYGKTNRTVTSRLAEDMADRVEIEFLTPASLEGMKASVAALPEGSLLLYHHFHQTRIDGFLEYDVVVPAMAAASSVPTLGTHDFTIRTGMAAGFVTDGFRQGKEAGRLAVRILQGTELAPDELVATSPNSAMVNEVSLERFGVATSRLPPEAVVLNHQPGFLERNREAILVSSVVIVLLLAIIVLLVLDSRNRRRALVQVSRLNERLEAMVEDKQVLMREIHHRTKNNLQVLQSMLVLQKMSASSEETTRILAALETRIMAISLIHRQLYDQHSTSDIDLSAYLNGLVEQLTSLAAEEEHAGAISFSFESQAGEKRVSMETAVPVGLIINESVTTSIRHATGARSIRVLMTRADDGAVALSVRDDGPGFPQGSATSHGLGLTLVHGLAKQIGAQLTLNNDDGAVTTVHLGSSAEE